MCRGLLVTPCEELLDSFSKDQLLIVTSIYEIKIICNISAKTTKPVLYYFVKL